MHQPDFLVKLTLEASISPSEEPSKVARALANITGLEAAGVTLSASSARLTNKDPKVLVHLRDALRDRHVRSAARRQLLLNLEGGKTTLMLNRQAAAAGVLVICGSPGESPLGPVYMILETDMPDKAVDWLTAYEEG